MEELLISRYSKMFELLSLESKLELISRLVESIKSESIAPKEESDKQQLAQSLFGAWSDTDEDLIDVIYSSRTISDREIDFDS